MNRTHFYNAVALNMDKFWHKVNIVGFGALSAGSISTVQALYLPLLSRLSG